MVDKLWVGTTGAYDTAGNWSAAVVPLDGESVYFTGSSAQSVTSGLTLAGAGDSLALLAIGPAYTGAIASSGSKLIAGVGITTIRMSARGGKAYINSAATTDCILDAAGGVTDFFEFQGDGDHVQGGQLHRELGDHGWVSDHKPDYVGLPELYLHRWDRGNGDDAG